MLRRKLTTAIVVANLFVGSTIAPLAAQQGSQSMKSDNKMSDGMMKTEKMAANKMSNKKHWKHKRHAKHKSNDTMQKNKNQ
jgi:pentapeptide MXKDX repeat protein